jgi:hypothetical protein
MVQRETIEATGLALGRKPGAKRGFQTSAFYAKSLVRIAQMQVTLGFFTRY